VLNRIIRPPTAGSKIQGGARKTFPAGSVAIASLQSKAGEIAFSQPVTRASDNIGGAAANAVMIELKTKPAGTDTFGSNFQSSLPLLA
jgi:hypothetical protein